MRVRRGLASSATPTTPERPPAPELVLPRGAHPVPTRTRLHTRRVPVAAYIAALLLIPGLVVGGFIGAGWWATTGKTTAAQAGGQQGEGATGVAAPAAPADIKGSTTVQQVLDAFPPLTAGLRAVRCPPRHPCLHPAEDPGRGRQRHGHPHPADLAAGTGPRIARRRACRVDRTRQPAGRPAGRARYYACADIRTVSCPA